MSFVIFFSLVFLNIYVYSLIFTNKKGCRKNICSRILSGIFTGNF